MILFVDDEPNLIEMLQMKAEEYGLSSRGTTSPIEALNILKTDFSIRVLVSDITMPEKSGWELLKSCEKIRPNVKRIVLTAYSEGSKRNAHVYYEKLMCSNQEFFSTLKEFDRDGS